MQQTKKTAKYCTKCKDSLGLGKEDLYCYNCGTKLMERRVAPPTKCECGHTPDTLDNFCTNCGKSLANQKTSKTKGVK